jgi:hypothetical protein
MRKTILILGSLIALTILPAGAQPTVTLAGRPPTPGMPASDPDDRFKLTAFNLDFPGGSPEDLVKAIEKATGNPLNVIIPTDDANVQLPPLKMNNVLAPQLFNALESASRQTVAVQNGFGSGYGGSYSQIVTDYGFKTSDTPVTDTSVWNFYVIKPSLPPVVSTEPICRVFQLQNYLNHGFTVDDITTAIQTGWKMSGITSPPELNYHKETNLLIAFGRPEELATIDSVLNALPQNYMDPKTAQSVFDQVNRMEKQVKQLSAQVATLTANPSEKSSGK